jgi:phosphoribosylanthranilate isomerase
VPERTRVKICGLRDPDHARVAAEAGADAIGLVFHPPSPRFLTDNEAARLLAAVPAFVTTVALFVDEKPATIERILARAPVDLIQFHGDESPEFCARFGRPYVRAVRMEPGVDLLEYARRFSAARALLLDAHVPGTPGGTGTTFDWAAIPRNLAIPLILSGGLDTSNVGGAIRTVRPWAVDVSSGVEAGRGVKDPAKIIEFIRKVRHEDAGFSA